MNIIVISCEGKVFVRPDTTWERDNEDFYVPDFVDRISASEVLFVRVSKPGRSVSAKFAERYYDGAGRGFLLYPEDMIDGSAEGFACACCLDHTSFLPFPIHGKEWLEEGCGARICEAIALATTFCYIRTGDIIAIELATRKPLCSRADGRFDVNSGDNSFSIIY